MMFCVVGFLFWGLRIGLAPQGTYAWYLHQGLQAAQRGDARTSELALMKALEKKRDTETLEKLGTLYQFTEQWDKALLVYQELHKRDVKNPIFSIHLIEAMTRTQRHSAADALFIPLRASLEKREGAELGLVMLLIARQKEREALLLLNQMLEREPNQVVYHNALAWTLLTAHNPRFRNPKLALRHAQLAVRETHSRIGVFLDTLATAYFQNKQPQKAVSLIHQAMRCQDAQNPLNLLMIHLYRQRLRFLKAIPRPAVRARSTSAISTTKALSPKRATLPPLQRTLKKPIHREPSSLPSSHPKKRIQP